MSLAQPALAATTADPIVDLGSKVLGVLFTVAGVLGTIGFIIAGIYTIIGNATGSSYSNTRGVMMVVGIAVGMGLAIGGPTIAGAVITALAGLSREIPVP